MCTLRNIFAALSAVVFLSSWALAQSTPSAAEPPTLEETQAWIVDKIVSYTWNGNGASHSYKVVFNQVGDPSACTMETEHRQSSRSPLRSEKYYSTIHIADIVNVSFTRKQSNTWMVITLKEDWAPLSNIDWNYNTTERTISYILRNEINDDDLPNRMRKAFSAMVGMCGGRPFFSKEAY